MIKETITFNFETEEQQRAFHARLKGHDRTAELEAEIERLRSRLAAYEEADALLGSNIGTAVVSVERK